MTENMWKCPECDEPEISTRRKGVHIAQHRREEKRVRTEQDKKYIAPDEGEPLAEVFKKEEEETDEFDLWNVITINGIDYVNTMMLEEGIVTRVCKPHRIGQVMYGEKGPFKITRALMNDLLNRDSIAREAEKRIFDSKKIKLHYETEGVRRMSMKA